MRRAATGLRDAKTSADAIALSAVISPPGPRRWRAIAVGPASAAGVDAVSVVAVAAVMLVAAAMVVAGVMVVAAAVSGVDETREI